MNNSFDFEKFKTQANEQLRLVCYALKMVIFVPRSARGTKKYVPRVPGAQTRDKIEFLHFTYYNCKVALFGCYPAC